MATLSLALAACGAAETSPPPPAQAQVSVRTVPFAQTAGAICTRLERDASVITGGRKPSDAEFARVLALWRAEFDHLAKLQAPAAHARAFDEMLTHYRRMATALAAMQAADDETVLAHVAVVAVEGTRGSRWARRAGLTACALFPEIEQPPKDAEATFDATRALVPSSAHVVHADKRDCNVAKSCRFEFSGSGSTRARLRSALATLRAKGWTHIRTGRSPTGSSWAMAYRNDYEAVIELLGERPPYCTSRQPRGFGCADSVWVHRLEIPNELTGG